MIGTSRFCCLANKVQCAIFLLRAIPQEEAHRSVAMALHNSYTKLIKCLQQRGIEVQISSRKSHHIQLFQIAQAFQQSERLSNALVPTTTMGFEQGA